MEVPSNVELVDIPCFIAKPKQDLGEPAPSLPMVVEPTCRYGHGKLTEQPAEYSMRRVSGAFVGFDGSRSIAHKQEAFRLSLWRCQACRYVELFDPD